MNRNIKAFASSLVAQINLKMFGVERISRLSLAALFTGGHILLEGNPGLGKTELVKTMGCVLKLPFGRIQFTPDLMPSDITGTYMPDFESGTPGLHFRPGPVFTHLLLADEINRATPKTQSAMLEAMAERQVTVLGERRPLADPFMVLATQNPIDQEGTYHLPEAQADRFMFKALMPIPRGGDLRRILEKCAGSAAEKTTKTEVEGSGRASPLLRDHEDSLHKIKELRQRIEAVIPLPSMESHIVNMFLASNRRFGEMEHVDPKQVKRLQKLSDRLFTYGLGPRAAIALMRGAKAWSLLFLAHSEYADGQALAQVLVPALRHRFKLELDWQEGYAQLIRNASHDENRLLDKLLVDFALCTAPDRNEYGALFREAEPIRDFVAEEGW